MKAVLFARVSTEDQATDQKTSLDEQERTMRRYADTEGYEVVEVIREAVSGRKQITDGILRVQDLAEDGKIDVVLVHKWNRLARTVRRFEDFLFMMKLAGVEIISLDGQSNKTSAGRLMNRMMAVFSEYQRDDLVETMQQGKRGQARRGNVVPGRYAPYGFYYDKEKRTYAVDEERIAFVRRIFRLVAGGASLGSLQREFTAQGVPTTAAGSSWHRSSFRDIVLNDIYRPHSAQELQQLVEAGNLSANVLGRLDTDKAYGISCYNQNRVEPTDDDRHITTGRPQEEWIAVPVDITDVRLEAEQVAKARSNIRDNVRPSSAGRRSWELKGLAYCRCGSRLTAYTTGKTKFYYVCGRRRDGCEHVKYHRAEALEQQVRRYALDLIRNPETLREQVEAEARRLKLALKDPAKDLRRWQKQLADADSERDRLIRLFKKGGIDEEEFDLYAAETDRDKAEAEAELDRLRDASQRMSWLDDLPDLVEDYLNDLPWMIEQTVYRRDGGDRLPTPYRVTPDTAQPPPTEINQEADAAKWRGLYEDLGLTVVVAKDGTLGISWGSNSSGRLLVNPMPRSSSLSSSCDA